MARTPRRTTSQRGYGWAHQRVREQWAPKVAAGVVVCARCGKPISPGQRWDLGHTEDRRAWHGPEHASCNRSAGGKNGNRVRRQVKKMTKRDW